MRRKQVLLLLAVTVLLAACGDVSELAPMPSVQLATVAASDKPVMIRFAVWDWQQASYADLIQAFEDANPDVLVQLVSINESLGLDPTGEGAWPDDWRLRLSAVADVVNQPVGSGMIEAGLVRDLVPFIDADSNFQPEDFYPGMLESYQWKGSIWTLPTKANFRLIFYDKHAFDEANVPYPEPGWTWDDFVTKAMALTLRQEDQVVRWGFVEPSFDPLSFIHGRVGQMFDDITDPPTFCFDQPEVIQAISWYSDLYLGEQVMPYLESGSMAETLIDGGQAAMWADASVLWWSYSQGRQIGTVPFPVDTSDARTTRMWVDGMYMSAGTSHPDAAWRWMSFLSRQPIIGQWSIGGQWLPARRSVAESTSFWDELDKELAGSLQYAVDHSYVTSWGVVAGYQAFYQAMAAILRGEKSVEEALAQAQVEAQAELQEELVRRAEATPVPTFVVPSGEEQAPIREEVTTISFISGPSSSELQRYRELAKQFHEMHPDLVVEVNASPLSDLSDLQGLAHTADCFLGYPSLENPANRAALLALEPLLDAGPSFPIADFYPLVLEQFTRQGQLWGLPAEVMPYVVEYNVDLFDAAGVDHPALDWTTDDFLKLAVTLTQSKGEEKQYGFVPEVYEGNILPLILERLGASPVNRSVTPPALSFNDPATVEAMRWYVDLATAYGVRPVFVTDFDQLTAGSSFDVERQLLIDQGRAAMWTNRELAADLQDRNGLNVGVAPLPVMPGSTSGGYLTASGYFISAQVQDPQVCWQWIAFLTGQSEIVRGLPARRSVAESDKYRQQVGDERAAAYLASVAGLKRPFQIFSDEPWLRGATYWLFQAYGQALVGEASVEEALDTAQGMADNYRDCVTARDAFSDREQWQACLEKTDPTLPDFLLGQGNEE